MGTASTVPTSNPQAMNQQARQYLLANAVNRRQSVISQTINPTANPVFTVQPRMVGLVKRFIVTVLATISNTGTQPIALTDTGIANLLSNVTYTDLNNNQRISTSGLHLSLLAASKRRGPYGAAYAFIGSGNVQASALTNGDASWPIFQAPSTIAPGASGTVRMVYEVPLAFSDDDLRGAVFANVIQANQQLAFTVNSNAVVAGTSDTTNAVYSGQAGAAGQVTSATFNVYQEYLDQIPTGPNGYILPSLDLSTVYELKTTTLSAITANTDYGVPFANMRDFHSVFSIYNHNGQADGRTLGTDLSFWALRAANMSDLFKVDPLLAAQLSRDILTFDLPAGVYFFDFRKAPISTAAYGNMQLVLNATEADAAANVTMFWESFGLLNTLKTATSLA